jgi:hypothetical protein
MSTGVGVGVGVGVLVGSGVGLGVGVAVGSGSGVGVDVGIGVGLGHPDSVHHGVKLTLVETSAPLPDPDPAGPFAAPHQLFVPSIVTPFWFVMPSPLPVCVKLFRFTTTVVTPAPIRSPRVAQELNVFPVTVTPSIVVTAPLLVGKSLKNATMLPAPLPLMTLLLNVIVPVRSDSSLLKMTLDPFDTLLNVLPLTVVESTSYSSIFPPAVAVVVLLLTVQPECFGVECAAYIAVAAPPTVIVLLLIVRDDEGLFPLELPDTQIP